MQEQHLYEYAVLRFVPRVEREEFINIGVIVYCGRLGYLKARFCENFTRALYLDPEVDQALLHRHALAVEAICKGKKFGGAIGQQPINYRFRWITANRSTILQSSVVHPGLCTDPEAELARLFAEQVL